MSPETRTDERANLRAYSGMGSALSITPEWRRELAAYSQWLRAASVPTSTIKLRSYHLKRFAVTTGLDPFSPIFADLIEHVGNHRWSANTKRSVRSSLRSFYKWALITNRMSINPAQALPEITAPIGKPRPAPEAAVTEGLLASDQRVRRMVAFGAWAGLRCCEIAVIHTKDLVLESNGWSLRVHGKGNKTRIVPLVDQLAQMIRLEAPGYLFPGAIDGHLSAAYVSKMISRALPPGWTAHTLRHRFASSAYAADQDIRAVQELLGHASVATTQIYTAVPDGALRRAAFAAMLAHETTNAA